MRNYELAVVLSSKLEDDERSAVIEQIKGYVERYNGTITEIEEWGKKKLAYEIKKMKEAYYYFIRFEADNNCSNQLEQELRIMEPVIRFLCIKVGS